MVRAGVSVTCHVMKCTVMIWSHDHDHEFKPRSGWTWVHGTSVLSRTWTKNIQSSYKACACTADYLASQWHVMWWNVLSWSGGHEFKPKSGWTWGAWYFCLKLYLNQKYTVLMQSVCLHCRLFEFHQLSGHIRKTNSNWIALCRNTFDGLHFMSSCQPCISL